MPPRLIVVGVPDDERNAALARAMVRAKIAAPTTLAWTEVIADARIVARHACTGDLLRIESPGGDPAAWRALAARGGSTRDVAHGEWRPGRAWFAGLTSVLAELETVTTGLSWTQRAGDLLAMTDKLACDERLRAAGAPVPEAFEAPPTVSALRHELTERRMHAAYVKPRWGSSGAGVLAYRWRSDREQLVTTARVTDDGRMCNDKRLTTYTDRAQIDRLIAQVIEDGAVVQRWIPKAGTESGPFDLRVVVIRGRVAQRVARVGRGTITNLHLGAARADVDAVLAPYGPAARDALHDTCLRAAAAFDRDAMVAIDVTLDSAGRPWVLECNAWGDLLRRTTTDDGLDAYDVQVRSMFRSAA